MKLKDSGVRREFDSGAVRDITEGKGRCDLLPLDIIGRILEDSQMTPEEVQSLAQAKADGRLKILPAKPGDIIYRPEALQFCWVITKVEIYEDEIVFIDDSDNIFRPDDIGKTVFLTRKAAEATAAWNRRAKEGE